MIFKRKGGKILRPPILKIKLAKMEAFHGNEQPAIAGTAIAKLSVAGRETLE